MWTANSIYNVTLATAAAAHSAAGVASAVPPPPPPGVEGSGDSEMAVTVNGVKIFSRGLGGTGTVGPLLKLLETLKVFNSFKFNGLRANFLRVFYIKTLHKDCEYLHKAARSKIFYSTT